MLRSFIFATAVLTGTAGIAIAQDAISAPVLRGNITVSSDIVRIGDVVENAGVASQIAISVRRISAPLDHCPPRSCSLPCVHIRSSASIPATSPRYQSRVRRG